MPDYLAFDPNPRRPAVLPPPKTCDSQFHVLGPLDKYPERPGAAYRMPTATWEAALRVHKALGIERGIIVQTTTYGADHAVVLDALAAMGPNYKGCANALAYDEFALTARDVLRLATIEGARTLGLGAVTGSLAPGKRADIIVVSVDAPNLGVLTDPARLLVTAAHPGNVDTVLADGRVLKRSGKLTSYDVAEVTRSARDALAGVLTRA